jgi:predicted glutamine amidotransferase
MCRAIIYLGKKTKMHPFTHEAHNSLVKQTIHPRYMKHGFNLTGNGFISWNHADNKLSDPIIYKSKLIPFYDYNFTMQTRMIETDCFISHVRGGALSPGVILTLPNAHPFLFRDAPFALAHNGGLYNGTFAQQQSINEALMKRTSPKWYSQIRGTTDSEHIYALLLTCLDEQKNLSLEQALQKAIVQTLDIIKSIRKKFKVYSASPINLFISNGEFIVVVRYTFDFGVFHNEMSKKHLTFYSLWFSYGGEFVKKNGIYKMTPGDQSSICFASEPLSRNATSWVEVPEYSMILVKRAKKIKMVISDISI